MKIKDLTTGKVFEYGSDKHHALVISGDGRSLTFEHLQNGDGSEFGNYRFIDRDEEVIPNATESYAKYGADCYFNVGGFEKQPTEIKEQIVKALKESRIEDCNNDTKFGVNTGLDIAVRIVERLLS